MSELFLYLESQFLCMVCLLIMWLMSGRNLKDGQSRVIAKINLIILAVTALDMIWAVIDGNPQYALINTLDQIVYLCLYAILGYRWLEFASFQLPEPIWKTRAQKQRFMMPVIVSCFLIALSPFTHWIFYVDVLGVYHRGPLLVLTPSAVTLVYILIASVASLRAVKHAVTAGERTQYYCQASMIIMPVITSVAQALLKPGMPLVQWGMTLSLLLLCLAMQNNRITRDSLTNLRNRFNFDNYLRTRMNYYDAAKSEEKKLYLIMGDLDRFKELNDTYGHMEGDRALQIVAGVLHKVCEIQNGFVARIGGDEFAILLEKETEAEVKYFCDEVRARLKKRLESEILYMHISLGWAQYEKNMTMTQFMNAADEKLYENKRQRKGL